MTLESAVNAPLEVEIKGAKYNLSEYTLYDFALFRRRIQSIKLGLVNTINDLNIRQNTINRILDTEIGDDELAKAMGSIEGITFLLWCMLKPNHNITLEQAETMVDSDNMNDILTWITKLSPTKLKKKVAEKK